MRIICILLEGKRERGRRREGEGGGGKEGGKSQLEEKAVDNIE